MICLTCHTPIDPAGCCACELTVDLTATVARLVDAAKRDREEAVERLAVELRGEVEDG